MQRQRLELRKLSESRGKSSRKRLRVEINGGNKFVGADTVDTGPRTELFATGPPRWGWRKGVEESCHDCCIIGGGGGDGEKAETKEEKEKVGGGGEAEGGHCGVGILGLCGEGAFR